MREIKFRGLTQEDKWIYGNLINSLDSVEGFETLIIPDFNSDMYANDKDLGFENWSKVKKETIGQYTGLKDCNGVDIYEGDIACKNNYEKTLRVVKWLEFECGFYFVTINEKGVKTNRRELDILNINNCSWHKVIGNIHQNKELLEV